jgi:hypothetical protein
MKESYPLQRKFINDVAPFENVMNEWPFLCNYDMLMQHFEQLMGFALESRLREAVSIEGPKLFDFFMSRSSLPTNTSSCSTIEKYWGWLPLMVDYFKDDLKQLIITVSVSTARFSIFTKILNF